MRSINEPEAAVGDQASTANVTGNGNSTEYAYSALRQDIISGRMSPGSRVNQVHVARRLNISRGPLREAVSRLQQEGLIDTVANHQARVAPLTVPDLEQLYAARIVLETLSLRISLPQLSADVDLPELERLIAAMDSHAQADDHESWDAEHLKFHRLLLSRAGDRLVQETDRLREHAERYRRVYSARPHAHAQAGRDHLELLQACGDGLVMLAVERLAHHQARTALGVAALLDPMHSPDVVREAVLAVTGKASRLPTTRR